MARTTKFSKVLIGTGSSSVIATPVVVNAGQQASGILDLRVDMEATVGVELTWTGSLTTATKTQFFWSPNNQLNWFLDTVLTGATGAQPTGGYFFTTYQVPKTVEALKLIVLNSDSTVNISVLAMASYIQWD